MYFSYHNVFAAKNNLSTQDGPLAAGATCQRRFRSYCRNGDGCFDPKTKIQMANGELKPINQIEMGDMVMTAAGTAAPVTNIVAGPEAKPMLRVGFKDKTVSVTEEHPFDTRRGLLRAKELKPFDEILTLEGGYRQLEVLETLPLDPEQMAWNVLVAGGDDPRSHMVIGDGIVAGDLYLQNRGLQLQAREVTLP
jgi:hypothetical protein